MTRFSVVVPMRSTEAFADECLWSVRRQTGADVEVIAVDDDSPDECGAIADRHARADDRITAVHLARSHGVGPARNAGIARASGDYVLFLDADDAFFDHRVLADLDAVLAATGDPDVLLFDYEEWRPCGLRRRTGLERVVPFDEVRLVAAGEHPAVLRASWVCWNKAYRREFVAAAGLRFPTGYYEDFAWSIPALLAAPRVAVSERVGVRYRKCRAGSTSRAVSPRHFEVGRRGDPDQPTHLVGSCLPGSVDLGRTREVGPPGHVGRTERRVAERRAVRAGVRVGARDAGRGTAAAGGGLQGGADRVRRALGAEDVRRCAEESVVELERDRCHGSSVDRETAEARFREKSGY